MVIIVLNFKILLSLLWLPHPTISKFYQPSTSNFFWIGNPTYYYYFFFFLEKGRTYVSIIITIVSNITMLMSHIAIFFRYLMPLSHGVNKEDFSRYILHLLLPYQFFTQFVCFTINTLSTFFCSDQIIAKNNAFSK